MPWGPKPGKHETYLLGGRRIPIPRHSEIPENTAQSIIKDAVNVINGRDEPR